MGRDENAPPDDAEPADSKRSTQEMSRAEIRSLLHKHGVDDDAVRLEEEEQESSDTDEDDAE